MKPRSESTVHRALGLYLGVDALAIGDHQELGRDLGIDVFDLIFVALRFEEAHPDAGEFPMERLDGCASVGDLVELFDDWRAAAEDRDAVLAGPPGIARALGAAWAPRRQRIG